MTFVTSGLRAVAALLVGALIAPAHAATAYSLADDGASLIRFDTATPGTVTTIGSITGAARLDAMDFRPSDGKLYGFDYSSDSIYTVNTTTGAATFVSMLSTPASTFLTGVDFDPVADRLRLVNVDGQNLRAKVADGSTTTDSLLAFNVTTPNIIDTAYSNSYAGAASTTAYYIDYLDSKLYTSADPDTGALSLVGTTLGVVIDSPNVGFDIYSNLGSDTAYATLVAGGSNGLYTINLNTGAATFVGLVNSAGPLYGLAIVPGLAPIPEPGTLAMFGAGALFLLGLRRRFQAPGAASQLPAP